MTGITAKTATITNLPAGFAINNGVQSGANWVVTLDPADPNHLQVELRYVLPTSATQPDGNGFLGSFNLNILFGAVNSNGATRTLFGQPDIRHPRRGQRQRCLHGVGRRQIDDHWLERHAARSEHFGWRRR